MSGASKKLMGTTAAAAGGPLAIEDVFSTYLYAPATSNSQVPVVNGIDLTGNDGMVWIKRRDGEAINHVLVDTLRGGNQVLHPNLDVGQYTASIVSSFSSDGFTTGTSSFVSTAPNNFASWTFRKAPRFFDVVTYTGDNDNFREVPHGLGVAPGVIMAKRTDSAGDWGVFFRGSGGYTAITGLSINTNNAAAWPNSYSDFTTDTVFRPSNIEGSSGLGPNMNESGATYVAYLFAHDPLGPSGDGSDGLIACGSYLKVSTSNQTIELGWEPQWVLIKKATQNVAPGGNWVIYDAMRGMTAENTAGDSALYPNLSSEEGSDQNIIFPTPTGFGVNGGGFTNTSLEGETYIYIAIRRGPMRQPESGTEVFDLTLTENASAPFVTSAFPVDTGLVGYRSGGGFYWGDRLRGANELVPNSTAAEAGANSWQWGYQDGWLASASGANLFYSLRRAPGFFDVVAYTGNGVAGRTVPHNLGVAPELMIVKLRNFSGESWITYSATFGAGFRGFLNGTAGFGADDGRYWNLTEPTSDVFSLGSDFAVNNSSGTYIAYLFATLPGVCKVGSYTGNGSSQTINCGFTSGARFVLIKRTDSTGDWYVWDTARGIVTGNDPHLSLNTTAAEVTTDDSVDPEATGFIVNQDAATNINVSSASYIYLAIA